MASNDNDKKGFGGFSDLVSDISKDVVAQKNKEQNQAPKNDSETKTGQNVPKEQPRQSTTQMHQSSPSGKGGAPGWVWAIISILVIIGLANISEKKSEVPYTDNIQSNDPYVPDNVTSESAVADQPTQSSLATDVDSSSDEDMPPIGTGISFTANQIRYCVSEDIRLGAIKEALDSYSQYEIDRFNNSVNDYNNRCGQFRYRPGVLERVRNEVSAKRSAIVIEGLNRLDSWRAKIVPSDG